MKFLGKIPAALLAVLLWCAGIAAAQDGPLPRDVLEPYIVPPMSLGEQINDKGVWQLLNSGRPIVLDAGGRRFNHFWGGSSRTTVKFAWQD